MPTLCFVVLFLFQQPAAATLPPEPRWTFNIDALASLPPDTLIMATSLYEQFHYSGFPSIMVSQDRGQTWRRHHFKGRLGNFSNFTTFGDRYAWFTLETLFEGSGFITGMVRTTDGGQTWQFIELGELSATKVILFHFFTPKRGMLITYTSLMSYPNKPQVTVYNTKNGGKTWRKEISSTESKHWDLDQEVIHTYTLETQPTLLYEPLQEYNGTKEFLGNFGVVTWHNETRIGLEINYVRDGKEGGFLFDCDQNQHLDRTTYTLTPGLGERVTDVDEKGNAGSTPRHELGARWWYNEFDPDRKRKE